MNPSVPASTCGNGIVEAWEECDRGEDGECRCCYPLDAPEDKGCQLRKDAECRLDPTGRAKWSQFAKCETLPIDKFDSQTAKQVNTRSWIAFRNLDFEYE